MYSANECKNFKNVAEEYGINPIDAMKALDGRVIKTPIKRLYWLEKYVNVQVYAKLEHFQHAGSFKYRGALYKLMNHSVDQTVIAASAGNHGFAVSQVSQELGLKTNICLPTTASRLKREHIINCNVGLLEYGNSLDEAVDYSIKLAKERGWTFVSPYNDKDVISANGTILMEMLEQVPEFKDVIVPIGGGGLISGMICSSKMLGKDLNFYGVEPIRYNSLSQSIEQGKIIKVVHQPTIADGLAVNLEKDSITYDIVKDNVSEIIQLTEEELSAGTLALLIHESLLVEPAGAAGIIACLKLARENKLKGPVMIPLCGGNLYHTTLAKIQRYPYKDPEIISLLNLKGTRTVDVPVKKVYDMNNFDKNDSEFNSIDYTISNLTICKDDIKSALMQINDYCEYSSIHEVNYDEKLINIVSEKGIKAIEIIDESINKLKVKDFDNEDMVLIDGERLHRFGLYTYNYIKSVFDWCAASYSQSCVSNFFQLASQDSPSCNYDRYECNEVKLIENRILELVELDSEKYSVTLTSSGMASYNLIEAYLTRYVLNENNRVLISPYIYFEASEQLTSLKFVECIFSPSYDVDTMVQLYKKHKPVVIFVDQLTNTTEQRIFDITLFLSEIYKIVTDKVTVVIDGTMLSSFPNKNWFVYKDKIDVIYYESCSKYLQLGLDLTMAGFVIQRIENQGVFDRIRRNSGTILYRQNANLFPNYSKGEMKKRMDKIGRNAKRIADELISDQRLRNIVEIFYPGNKSHIDYELANQLKFTGGCVTFKLLNKGENHKDQLESLIERCIYKAKNLKTYLVKGVSFGHTVPRISAASSIAEFENPFLRLYAGCLSDEQVTLLIEILREELMIIGG